MTLLAVDPVAALMPFVAPLDGLSLEEKRPVLLRAYEQMGRLLAELRSLQAAGTAAGGDAFDFDVFTDVIVDRIVECHVASGLVDPDFDALSALTLLCAFRERLAAIRSGPRDPN